MYRLIIGRGRLQIYISVSVFYSFSYFKIHYSSFDIRYCLNIEQEISNDEVIKKSIPSITSKLFLPAIRYG